MKNEAEQGGIKRLWAERTDNLVQLKPERAYLAYEVREHPRGLHICCATQPSRFPAYSSLLDITFDHHFNKAFTLVYSFMLVEVTGTHLSAVVHAINYGNCERITEYHPKLHDPPAPDAPVIQSVKITAAIGATERRETSPLPEQSRGSTVLRK
jgi:hypothetical protein